MENSEQELYNVLEVMVLHTPGTKVQDMLELNDAIEVSLKRSETELEEQLREIKGDPRYERWIVSEIK